MGMNTLTRNPRPIRLALLVVALAPTVARADDARIPWTTSRIVGTPEPPRPYTVELAFPKHKIHEIKDPIYANVKGFQIAGMNYARCALEKGVRTDLVESKTEAGIV